MFTKLFLPVLTKHWKCTVEEVKHYTQKEKRIIDTLEPVMMRHRLVVDLGIVKQGLQETLHSDGLMYSLFYQMSRITRDRGSLRHDDRLDVLAMAVRYWVDAMARDEEIAVEGYREQVLQNELRVFMEHVVGNTAGNYSRDFRMSYVNAGRDFRL